MELIVFCEVMLLFWVAAEHFGQHWSHVHHVKMIAGNAAYDKSIGNDPPGSVQMPSKYTATVSVSNVGASDDGDYAQQLRAHYNVPPLAYEQLLTDKKLANQKSGEVKVRARMRTDEGHQGWVKDRSYPATAQVLMTPIEPKGIPGDRNAYDWKVAEKIRDELRPFQGFQ